MTDLHTLADAISNKSPNIKAFCQADADAMDALTARVAALEAAAPPPPPPPSGSVLWQNTYTQTAPPYGWDWGFQNIPATMPVTVAGGSMTVTMLTGSGGQHAEGLKKWTLTLGEDLYFGFRCLFHSPWGEPSPDGWGAVIMQGDYQAFVNSTWGLFAHADHVRFVLLSGKQSWTGTPNQAGTGLVREYNNSDGAAQGPSPRVISGLQADTLYSVVVRVKAEYDATGVAQAWVNGGSYSGWTQTMDLQGVPTLQWGTSNTGAQLSNTASGYNVSHKFGYYTGSRTAQRTFSHDRPLIATSLAAAQAELA